jgi:hypothetical protein
MQQAGNVTPVREILFRGNSGSSQFGTDRAFYLLPSSIYIPERRVTLKHRLRVSRSHQLQPLGPIRWICNDFNDLPPAREDAPGSGQCRHQLADECDQWPIYTGQSNCNTVLGRGRRSDDLDI